MPSGIHKKVNRRRVKNGRRALQRRADLTELAQRWAGRMAKENKLYHSPFAYAENVGVSTAMAGWRWRIVEAWMWSAGHRANILNHKYTRTGVGVARGHGRRWVCQLFA